MTAGELQALNTKTAQDVALIEGVTEQALLRGIVAAAEAFGLTHGQDRLTAKLQAMNPELRATILTPKAEQP